MKTRIYATPAVKGLKLVVENYSYIFHGRQRDTNTNLRANGRTMGNDIYESDI